MNNVNENGRSMIEMLEEVKQPLNAVLRRQAQVFRCCQSAFAPRRNTENQVTEAPLGARQRQCALAQSGRSMIEMLGVLAIIGVLSVGGIAGYSKAMQRYRINKTIEQITYMAGAIRTFFAPQKSYSGLTSYCEPNRPCLAKKAKLVPDDMWVEGEEDPQNVWGVDIDVQPIFSLYNSFKIQYYGVPQEACIELLTQDWSSANITGIYAEVLDGYFYALRTPVSIEDAITTCVNEATLEFYVDLDVNSDWWLEFERNCSIEVGGC